MKTRQVDITIGRVTYSVRVRLEHIDRFYELIRLGSTNRVFCKAPILDESQLLELWGLFGEIGQRMMISNFFEHLTSVSGDYCHAPIQPGKMIEEMISSLPDDE